MVNHLCKWLEELQNLLFPPRCGICSDYISREVKAACPSCLQAVSYVSNPVCTICGRIFEGKEGENHTCEQCLRINPPFSLARSITFYDEPVRTLLHKLKYKYDTTTVAPLGKIAQSFDFSPFQECDIIQPVPLHGSKLKKRGMNQALILARLFFPGHQDKISIGVLRRIRPTISQTELDLAGRKRNVKAAFVVQKSEIIENKSICLVDDIYTTGITVKECAATLRQAGAADVKVVTMARVRLFK